MKSEILFETKMKCKWKLRDTQNEYNVNVSNY